MKYSSIADIYLVNQKIREQLVQTVGNLSKERASALLTDEKWTIEQIVEHLALVGTGVARICSKLLASAKEAGDTSDGKFELSADFNEKAAVISVIKVDAPERVQPTGGIDLSASLERLATVTSNFDSFMADMEQLNLSGHTFPHPFFGDLTASEWLVMLGWHEARHTKQIETLLGRLR